jgi:hypothetical protein
MEQKSNNHQCRRQPSALAHRTKQEFNDTPHLALFIEKIICLKARDKLLFFEGRAWLALSCRDKLFFPASFVATRRMPNKKPVFNRRRAEKNGNQLHGPGGEE